MGHALESRVTILIQNNIFNNFRLIHGAFFTGWFFWIGNTLACSMYALIFALTVRAYFIPEVSIALITLITTILFTIINLKGMKEAIIVITVMNLVELAVLVCIAVLGFTDI